MIDEVTKNIQGDIPWCMLFADDVVQVDESRAGVNRKLELWRQTLNPRVLNLVGQKPSICGAILVAIDARTERLV